MFSSGALGCSTGGDRCSPLARSGAAPELMIKHGFPPARPGAAQEPMRFPAGSISSRGGVYQQKAWIMRVKCLALPIALLPCSPRQQQLPFYATDEQKCVRPFLNTSTLNELRIKPSYACNWSTYTKLIEEAITERHSITMTTDSIQFCLNGQQISSITFNLNPY